MPWFSYALIAIALLLRVIGKKYGVIDGTGSENARPSPKAHAYYSISVACIVIALFIHITCFYLDAEKIRSAYEHLKLDRKVSASDLEGARKKVKDATERAEAAEKDFEHIRYQTNKMFQNTLEILKALGVQVPENRKLLAGNYTLSIPIKHNPNDPALRIIIDNFINQGITGEVSADGKTLVYRGLPKDWALKVQEDFFKVGVQTALDSENLYE